MCVPFIFVPFFCSYTAVYLIYTPVCIRDAVLSVMRDQISCISNIRMYKYTSRFDNVAIAVVVPKYDLSDFEVSVVPLVQKGFAVIAALFLEWHRLPDKRFDLR